MNTQAHLHGPRSLFSPNVSSYYQGAFRSEHWQITPPLPPELLWYLWRPPGGCLVPPDSYLMMYIQKFTRFFSSIILWLQVESWVEMNGEAVHRPEPRVFPRLSASENAFPQASHWGYQQNDSPAEPNTKEEQLAKYGYELAVRFDTVYATVVDVIVQAPTSGLENPSPMYPTLCQNRMVQIDASGGRGGKPNRRPHQNTAAVLLGSVKSDLLTSFFPRVVWMC